MQKNKTKILILGLLINLPLTAASAQDDESSDWYVVNESIDNESIEGEAYSLFSQLLFADKNSLSGTEKEPTISISELRFGEVKKDKKFQLIITDNRMQISINCEKQEYKIRSLEQYDQDNIKIKEPVIQTQTGQWQKALTPAYQALVQFSCDPDNENYVQPFEPNTQPLEGLVGYLNADWSK